MPKSKKKKKKINKQDLLTKALKRISLLEHKSKRSKTRLARPIVQRPPAMNKRDPNKIQSNTQPSAPMNRFNIEPKSSLMMTYDLLKERDVKNNTDELIKRLPAQFAAQMQNQIAQAQARGEANVNIAITNAMHNTQTPPDHPLVEQNTSEPLQASDGPSSQIRGNYVTDAGLREWSHGKDLASYGLQPNATVQDLKNYIVGIRRMNADGSRKSIDSLFNEASAKRLGRLSSISSSVDASPSTPVSQAVQNLESGSS